MENKYSNARATKTTKTPSANVKLNKTQQKEVKNLVKKSPLAIVAIIAIIIGVTGGFLCIKYFSTCKMLDFKLNGTPSAEADYIVVDIEEIKQQKILNHTYTTTEALLEGITYEDCGIECKILGIDFSNSFEIAFLYREDISHDTQEVDDIDFATPGVYYIKYTTNNVLFKNCELIRTIIVLGVENDG